MIGDVQRDFGGWRGCNSGGAGGAVMGASRREYHAKPQCCRNDTRAGQGRELPPSTYRPRLNLNRDRCYSYCPGACGRRIATRGLGSASNFACWAGVSRARITP